MESKARYSACSHLGSTHPGPQGIPAKPKPPSSQTFVRRAFAFSVPTLCDATATTLLNIGLFYT